jgi:hypothetical protein
MTDIFRLSWNGDHGQEREMHPNAGVAKKAASELRNAGINSTIEKITLAKMGKKELMCSIYNNTPDFAEEVTMLKEVQGMKKPKDPIAAEKMKQRTVANKHRGVMPMTAGAAVAKAGTENPSMAPKAAINKGTDQGAASTAQVKAPAATVKPPTTPAAATAPAAAKPTPKKAPNVPETSSVSKASESQGLGKTAVAEKGDLATGDIKL